MMVEGTDLFMNNEGGCWKSALIPYGRGMVSLLRPPP